MALIGSKHVIVSHYSLLLYLKNVILLGINKPFFVSIFEFKKPAYWPKIKDIEGKRGLKMYQKILSFEQPRLPRAWKYVPTCKN